MNTKKDRILFCNQAKEILKENGFVLIESIKEGDCFDKDIFELKTAKNSLKSTVYNQTDNKLTYSVFCILDKPSKTVGNPYSGKVNFHVAYSNPLEAIADFEDHIKLLIENEL